MHDHLLLPVDLSGPNEETLLAVRTLAANHNAAITLLHVVETLHDAAFNEMEEFYSDLRAKAEAVLADWAGRFKETGLPVNCEIVYGARVKEVVRFVEENDISTVILKSRAFDRDNPADTFGTLSHQIALMAPCSVLLVRAIG